MSLNQGLENYMITCSTRIPDTNPNTDQVWFKASFKKITKKGKDLTNYILYK